MNTQESCVSLYKEENTLVCYNTGHPGAHTRVVAYMGTYTATKTTRD
jgi:hypothetical protein